MTEVGIDYHLELRNLPVTVTDPPGAPDSLHRIDAPVPKTGVSVESARTRL